MPTEQRYKFVTSALKVLFFLFFSVTLSFAHAASLGRLTVLSSLGQPLRAKVELTSVTPEEASSLAANLAPGEAYKRSGIDYTSLLQTLNIAVEKEGERYFVSILSTQPVNEPYIGILLELSTGSERKGREYVIMLDPAEWTNLRSAPLSSAASMQRLSRQQRAGRQSSQAFLDRAVRPASVIPEKEKRDSTGYVVSRGDTLSKIAGRLGERNISLEQMLVALYRNNPDAFLDSNMNLLKEGAVLSIPQMADAGDVSRQDARRIVRLHAANFHGYSHRLAGMVQKSAPRTTAKTGPVVEGKVSASVKEQPSPVSKMPDRLELSKARQDAVSAGITAEEKDAMNRAIEDANRRISELEKNVSELRSLLEIVSKNGTALTKPAEAVSGQEAKTPETQPEAEKPGDAQLKAKELAKIDADSPQTATGTIEKTPSSDTDASSEEKKVGIDPDQTLAGKNAKASKKSDEDDEDDEDEDEGEDEDEEDTKKKSGFFGGALWYVAAGITPALLVLIILMLRMRRKKPAAPAPAPAPVAKPKEEKAEEDANPNIISGRDFLESITGREVVDEEGDEDTYRPMMDDEDDDDDPRARYDDEEVLEEIADIPEQEDEPEEIAQEQEEVILEPEEEGEDEEEEAGMPEEDIFEPDEAAPEEMTPEPEEGDEEEIDEEEVAPEPEEEEDDEPVPLELDLSDINLEPDTAEEEEEDLPDMASWAEAEKPEFYNAEMAAKLELAQAYLDMKDKDGARELLEEVLERGTPRQIAEAEQLMQYL